MSVCFCMYVFFHYKKKSASTSSVFKHTNHITENTLQQGKTFQLSKNTSGAYSSVSFPRIDLRKGTTLKRLIWKSLEVLSDSTTPPPCLHKSLVPQLTNATCERHHSQQQITFPHLFQWRLIFLL